MRMRENKPTIEQSMASVLEINGRDQLVRHVIDTLKKKGVVVVDEMIHVTHYGFDDRIDWDEHIIVVDRFGVFGFTDSPCLPDVAHADFHLGKQTGTTAQQLSHAEVESAYGSSK